MYWRRRRKRKRAKARFKQEGMTARQLAAKVGVNVRTVRFYTAERVLPAPEFRGAATRYGRMHLLRMAAIRHLQRDKRLSLPIIRRHLESVDLAELERLAAAFLPELGASPAAAVVAPAAASASPVPSVNDTWQRLALLPGLEIHLHSSASAEVRALARSVVERLSTPSGSCDQNE